MEPTNNKAIYLYAGKGTDLTCVKYTDKSLKNYLGNQSQRVIQITDPSPITQRSWEDNTEAIVIPGGHAGQIRAGLDFSGIEKIKNFVERHQGGYIGFCAGGYLAGPMEYHFNNTSSPFSGNLGLSIIKQQIIGPAISRQSIDNPIATEITDDSSDEKYSIFWNQGGYYPHKTLDRSSYHDFAWYQTADQKVAALKSRTHRVVISNVHPELQMSLSEMEQHFPLMENKEALAASSARQTALFGKICHHAGI